MNIIDEIRKIYPDAICVQDVPISKYCFSWGYVIIIGVKNFNEFKTRVMKTDMSGMQNSQPISNFMGNKKLAWEDAYETMKNNFIRKLSE
jgi:hypothetical protein